MIRRRRGEDATLVIKREVSGQAREERFTRDPESRSRLHGATVFHECPEGGGIADVSHNSVAGKSSIVCPICHVEVEVDSEELAQFLRG